MSLVKDQAGNVLNTPARETINGRGERRYKDADCTTLDWFDTHPRPRMVDVVTGEVTNGERLPTDPILPSAADLDAVAAEERIKKITESRRLGVDIPAIWSDVPYETPSSSDDVPRVQLPVGQLVEGLAGGQEVSGSASPSVSPAGDVPYISPYQNVN